ncbi:ABC transporter substrate-binding protein [Cellulomonas aerilata]|uniref:ABC transporter substrate-binding protein n=1 Tax=Cellulomonas aerilata TaxID=515326 RepID=A0A512D9M9_9CELL|nr:ABC transporter substrate-binding protein [Cellulomonas aerilata]GEO32970.1 ABC transporter substrate-binding protein [Cellulomonas aerilata]
MATNPGTGSRTGRAARGGVAALSAVLLVAACSGGGGPRAAQEAEESAAPLAATYEGPEVTLQFWNGFTGADGPFMQSLVDEFNTEHDNITVAMESQAWAEYYESVPAAVSTGNGPHIGAMHVDQVATYAARNVLSSVDDVAEVLALEEDAFAPAVWQAGLYDDRRYSVPLDVHPIGFFYNRTLMEQAGLDPENPPQDRESYEAALDAFQEAGIQGHWVSPYAPGARMFESLAKQFGAELYSEDGEQATWDSPEALEALEWMLGLVEEGHSPPDVANPAEAIAFQNGENPFYWGGIWMINTFAPETDLDWGVAPLPVIGEEQAVFAGSHQLVLLERQEWTPDERQASAVFIDWVVDNSLGWAEGGQVPAAAEVRESPEFAALPHVPVFASELEDTFFPPSLPGIAESQTILWTALNEVLLGDRDPQEALEESARAANEALERSREQFATAE